MWPVELWDVAEPGQIGAMISSELLSWKFVCPS